MLAERWGGLGQEISPQLLHEIFLEVGNIKKVKNMNSRIIISLAMFILATTLLSNTESMLGVSAKVLEQSYKSEGGVMNSSDEITLIVSGDGTTKSEATKIGRASCRERV